MRIALLIILVCITCSVIAQESPTLRYEGSSTIAHFIEDAEKVYGKVSFEIQTETESSGGEKAILEGLADIGGVARVPSPQVLGKGVVSTLIGWDAIAIVVNNSNTVDNLTKEQLKGIYTNRITNWNELGGPDLEIKPYIVGTQSATRKVCRAVILENEDYVACETVTPDKDILSKVMSDPAAIGQISFSFLEDSKEKIRALSIDGQQPSSTNQNYPITRPLYLLWWTGRDEVTSFIEWTQSRQAQELIMKRFIGKSQENQDRNGDLIVYTRTYAVEEGGAYFYPHEPYEIYNDKNELIQRVENHLEATDENPSKLSLPPGKYLIWTETSKKTGGEKLLVKIEAGETARVFTNDRLEAERVEPQLPIFGNKLKFFGDFRFRAEQDWDSRRSNGTYRDNRGRLRIRLRFGFNYQWNDHFTFGARIRSGSSDDPQSPHITLGDDFREYDINIDRAYLRGNYKDLWLWVGKNNLPLWKQHEMWWDDDVTPEGIALGGDFKINEFVRIKPVAGYFLMFTSGIEDASIQAGQVSADLGFQSSALTLSSGYLRFDNMPDRNSGNQLYHEYQLLISGAEFTLKKKIPVTIGLDYLVNLENYDSDSLISANGMQDEKMGFVGKVNIGSLSDKGKVLVGYYYSYISKYSVVDYIAQDDWVRWSFNSAPGTRSSNFSGHEARLAYAFGKGFHVIARAYFVKAIKRSSPSDMALENGKRFRLDLNINF
ncbi:MAG: hypothetical protein HKN92_04635 [Chitinophagales bacterium]|nr:hypothetical protein [Chitinophagales bacterium]